MADARILVLTTVHRADDTRIREKLIPTLAPLGTVTYAARAPAPSSSAGIDRWVELPGSRLRRNLLAARLLVGRGYDVAVTHDPELLPASIFAGMLGRRVVVDIHENVPGQLLTKDWLPAWLRRPLAWTARGLLRLAERACRVTLAEPGYQRLFTQPHPVFANYPDDLPDPRPSDGTVVYVGDVTAARGVPFLADVMASVAPDTPCRIIGPCTDDMARELRGSGAHVLVTGPLPHPAAMEAMASAAVGVAPLFDTPNYRHSLPTKVIEYLGSGVPVVASDLPGTRDEIGNLPGVHLVRAADRRGWDQAITAALADGELREAAQQNALLVRQQFAWPTEPARRWYREVLASPT